MPGTSNADALGWQLSLDASPRQEYLTTWRWDSTINYPSLGSYIMLPKLFILCHHQFKTLQKTCQTVYLLPKSATALQSCLHVVYNQWNKSSTFHSEVRPWFLNISASLSFSVYLRVSWVYLIQHNICCSAWFVLLSWSANNGSRCCCRTLTFINSSTEVMFSTCVHLLVSLLAGLLIETWTEDGSRPRIMPINFWCGSGWGDDSRMTLYILRVGMFSYMFVDFSGTYAWILTKKKSDVFKLCARRALVGVYVLYWVFTVRLSSLFLFVYLKVISRRKVDFWVPSSSNADPLGWWHRCLHVTVDYPS